MKKTWSIFIFITAFLLIIGSCKKEEATVEEGFHTTPYNFIIPPGFPPPVIDPRTISIEGVKLGRKLYYDDILSSNGLSCSSCHSRTNSFSAPYHVHPNGDTTSIPVHVNLAWKSKFLWEGSMASIEEVCMGDFEPEFFNTNMVDLKNDLKNHAEYPSLFYQAFQLNDVSILSDLELKQKILNAIAQFMNTMVSNNSVYDRFQRQELNLTQEELRGYIIFNTEEGDCFHCHGSVYYSDYRFRNNGLEANPAGQDMGYYNFTHDSGDIGKFISPTLRNIELSAPYMHDGRFQTLEEVVDFYDHDVHLNSPNIDPIMTKPFKVNGLQLNAFDKQCLVKFLKTFTDTAFINNPAYKKPL
jgi:cytochrome c peroxidase